MRIFSFVLSFFSLVLITNSNPLNAQSEDCDGVAVGSSLIDDCGVCQSAYLYNVMTHEVTMLSTTEGVDAVYPVTLVQADSDTNPYWNASCLDCDGVAGGLAMIDECGECQSALIYDYLNHVVTGIALTSDVELGSNEMLVLPDNPSNPYWNASCIITPGCTDTSAINFSWMATEDDGSCEYYDLQSCQNIQLEESWSIFSTYITTENMDISSMFEFSDSNISIIKNYLGHAFLPEWNFNAIGELTNTQGYQIKLYESESLDFCGTYNLPEETPIQLPSGWSLVGYLRTSSSPVDAVLSDIVDNVIIIKDYLGNVYLPEWNFNGLGDMFPGQGYQIKTRQQEVLNYISNNDSYKISPIDIINNNSSHFSKAKVTDNNMTVIIEDAAWDVLPLEGSEIAAFDKKGNMVGSAIYSSPVSVVTVWGDDLTTTSKEGMLILEEVSFKVWNTKNVIDFTISEWIEGSSSYQVDGISVASSIVTSNGITEINYSERELVKVINILGQEVNLDNKLLKGKVLFNIYNDGSVVQFVR